MNRTQSPLWGAILVAALVKLYHGTDIIYKGIFTRIYKRTEIILPCSALGLRFII